MFSDKRHFLIVNLYIKYIVFSLILNLQNERVVNR